MYSTAISNKSCRLSLVVHCALLLSGHVYHATICHIYCMHGMSMTWLKYSFGLGNLPFQRRTLTVCCPQAKQIDRNVTKISIYGPQKCHLLLLKGLLITPHLHAYFFCVVTATKQSLRTSYTQSWVLLCFWPTTLKLPIVHTCLLQHNAQIWLHTWEQPYFSPCRPIRISTVPSSTSLLSLSLIHHIYPHVRSRWTHFHFPKS